MEIAFIEQSMLSYYPFKPFVRLKNCLVVFGVLAISSQFVAGVEAQTRRTSLLVPPIISPDVRQMQEAESQHGAHARFSDQ